MTKHTPIQIRAGDLKPAIAGLGKLITTRAKLPALQCVKVETLKRDTLRLTGTDLTVTLALALEVPAKLNEKVEPFLVPLVRLRNLTRQTRAGDLLTLGPAAKAPTVGEFPETTSFRASSIPLPDTAATGLQRAFACASRDITRHILQGAFLDTSGKGPAKSNPHRIVGTDGRHLFSSNSLHLPQVKVPVILPDHKLWQWKPIAESRPWTLCVGAASKNGNGVTPFRITGPFWSITGNTIDGNYPNYRQVVPRAEEFKTRVTVSEPALEAIARLIPRMPGKKLANRPIGIHLEKGRLGLLARETNDEPWILHPIDTVANVKGKGKGPNLSVFVNRDYLQKTASFGLGGIALIDAMSPVQFTHEGDLMIVMPIRAIDPERIERPKLEPAVKAETRRAPKKEAPPASTRQQKPNRKPRTKSKRSADPDPIDEVETRIAEANEALASAGKRLESATGSLKTARRQRGEERKELRGFRSLFSSIKKIATGSN
jgi:hypothetical protein